MAAGDGWQSSCNGPRTVTTKLSGVPEPLQPHATNNRNCICGSGYRTAHANRKKLSKIVHHYCFTIECDCDANKISRENRNNSLGMWCRHMFNARIPSVNRFSATADELNWNCKLIRKYSNIDSLWSIVRVQNPFTKPIIQADNIDRQTVI